MSYFKKALIIVLPMVLFSGCNGCDSNNKEHVTQDTAASTVTTVDRLDTTATSQKNIVSDSLPAPVENSSKVKITPAPIHDSRTKFKVIDAKPNQIVGQWFQGDLFEEFLPDGTGLTWDTSEDIYKNEAQHFNWELKEGKLTTTHNLTLGGFIRKVTYIAKIDSTQMVRYDKYGNSTLFKKNF